MKNSQHLNQIILCIISLFLIASCAEPKHKKGKNDKINLLEVKERILLDFENESDIKAIELQNARSKLIVNEGNHGLEINFDSLNNHDSSVYINPSNTWNFNDYESAALVLDIENSTKSSTHIYIYTYDKSGAFQLSNVAVPAESNNSYLIELKVPSFLLNTGIRNDPPSWPHNYISTIWRGGTKTLDTSAITSIRLLISGVLENKQLIIDNLRVVKPNNFDPEYLTGLVDEYGQNAKQDFAGKVYSADQLRSFSQQEQENLTDQQFPSRSTFNGWINGPKLKSTGYFRAEKYQGKWSLVDPEGYLFFSNGIANIRMANTSTITGYDFDAALIKQRDAGDYTPEDSIGLNTAPKQAWPSRHISSQLRADMFTWLPSYSEAAGANYGYRRSVHSGSLKKGETFSFYRANLARKYATQNEEALMQDWRDTTIKRMHNWGFTSFGNWVDASFYQMNRLPYFANGWIIGDFKTVNSGNDYWGAMPDPFDPVFTQRTNKAIKKIADEVKDNPWCVGVFIDNEKSWGSMGSPSLQYGIVINGLKKNANDSPLKQEFINHLKNKYQNIENLNSAWDLKHTSWAQLSQPVELTSYNAQMLGDFSELLYLYADAYFSRVDKALTKYMPNHLYMGPRFAHWAMTPEVLKAAAKYVDVMSYNYYREGIDQPYWDFLAELDKPSIIGEFHNGAIDSGLLNPGLIHAESQFDRGEKYKSYLNSVIENPYFVGAHWFQYIDSPLTGRAYDGENYNVGFVSVADIPYTPLVKAAQEVNKSLYIKRFGK
ncbi:MULTISPECIES: beta-galactosidase [unclassified Cellvibrio]|uniref:beta-galactosidase n=1 Tax=unclassified Cellvibrio TaxID=2624793 RepID=UPI0012474BCD|nr:MULTISPECIES: beta-galactosidase [unclassified Cellvibrio]QEY14913.1 agarase [Cellvibrio sp. KY-GH-1]UUA73811.1 beta-galactosidase [Cellvibrio sp. QJXJ]